MSAALLLLLPSSSAFVLPRLAPRATRATHAAVASATDGWLVDRRLVSTSLAAAVVTGVAFEGASAAIAYPKLRIVTTAGIMEFDLWDDVAPAHVNSFLSLAKKGFFEGQAFHRIIPGFVIQGGDPNTKVGYGPSGTFEGGDAGARRKWGTGGPGYSIKAEFNERKHEFGVLSMARSQDPNSAGSQFFVCLGTLPSLDNKYTTFGKLTSGGDVLTKLGAAATVKGDVPIERQGIEKVEAL